MENQSDALPLNPPFSGPLRIDVVTTPAGGGIGMCHCPGRRGRDSGGQMWDRDIHSDIAVIKTWQPDIVISLIETREFTSLGVPDLANVMSHHWAHWYHVPIPDMHPPDAAALAAWNQAGPTVMSVLQRGGRVVIHCAAGLGRTGTIAAKLLIALGNTANEAITAVRAARPGTIETLEQEAFVRTGRALN